MRSRLTVLVGISAFLTVSLTACTQQQSKVSDGSQSLSESNSFRRNDDINIQVRTNRNATDINVHGDVPQAVPLEDNEQVVIEQSEPNHQQLYVVEPSDRDTIFGDQPEPSNQVKKPAVKVDADSRLGSVHVSAPFVKIDKDSNSRNVRIKLPGIRINADVE